MSARCSPTSHAWCPGTIRRAYTAKLIEEFAAGKRVILHGSLELVIDVRGQQVRERLWFTRPNLRLRSSVANQGDGNPAHVHFSSEIRRVSKA